MAESASRLVPATPQNQEKAGQNCGSQHQKPDQLSRFPGLRGSDRPKHHQCVAQ